MHTFCLQVEDERKKLCKFVCTREMVYALKKYQAVKEISCAQWMEDSIMFKKGWSGNAFLVGWWVNTWRKWGDVPWR